MLAVCRLAVQAVMPPIATGIERISSSGRVLGLSCYLSHHGLLDLAGRQRTAGLRIDVLAGRPGGHPAHGPLAQHRSRGHLVRSAAQTCAKVLLVGAPPGTACHPQAVAGQAEPCTFTRP